MKKPRLLLVGDFACTTGFARVNHALASRLANSQGGEWDLFVLGINTPFDPHPIKEQFKQVFPAGAEGDLYGVNRYPHMLSAIKPEVVLIHGDAWNVNVYREAAEGCGLTVPPTVAYCPPDAANQPAGVKMKVAHLLTPTQFGLDELVKGGYEGPGTVVPYGVDTAIYRPLDRIACRKELGFPDELHDAFFIGRADRNAPRKRYDLTLQGFAAFLEASHAKDAYLYLHCAMKDVGWDLKQLAKYYGILDHVWFSDPNLSPGQMPAEKKLPVIYNSWNLHLSTARGEGMGLVALESAACRVAQVVPKYSAYGEWLDGAARMLPVTNYDVTTGGINTVGGTPSVADIAEGLVDAYAGRLTGYDELAHARATEPRFNWDVIAASVNNVLHEAAGV